MEDLKKIYKGRFFAKRNKLNWRVDYVCPAINNVLHPKSLIDVGCATGDFVAGFLKMGIDAYGLEGTENVLSYLEIPSEKLYIFDLRTPLHDQLIIIRSLDLALCLEVAEHIEPEYVDVFLDNLCSFSDKVLMSFAPPGQEGHHHVNCQESSYWIDKMANRNYLYRFDVVEKVREGLEPVKHKREIRSYYQHLLFFTKVDSSTSSSNSLSIRTDGSFLLGG